MSYFRKFAGVIVCGVLAIGLSACDQSEQDRPLTYEKGVYGGANDQELDETQRKELRRRGELQRF